MDVNDNAYILDRRVARTSIASKLAPTGAALPSDLTSGQLLTFPASATIANNSR